MIYNLTAGVWTQIATGQSVIAYHQYGGQVVYSVSATAPSNNADIFSHTKIGEAKTLEGAKEGVWALAIQYNAKISVNNIVLPSDATRFYDGVSNPVTRSLALSKNELFTAAGIRFSHTFDIIFASGSSKYFMYRTPPAAQDTIVVTLERRFKTLTGPAELKVLNNSTGAVSGTAQTTVRNENTLSSIVAGTTVYNLTDDGGTNPSLDGPSFETDFATGTGAGSNSAGGISPLSGSRFYGPDKESIIKITNLHNADNRTILAYSWLELPSEYIDP